MLSTIGRKKTLKNKGNKIQNVICNSAQFGLISQTAFFDKEIVNDANTENYFVIEHGDFVYNPRVSTFAPYGPVNLYKEHEPGIVSPLYFVFSVSKASPLFLLYRFQSPCWYRYIYLNGDSGARSDRVSIRNDVFMSQTLSLPDLNEQEKIGHFFELLDQRIEIQNKIIGEFNSLIKAISGSYFKKIPVSLVPLEQLIVMGKAGGTPPSSVREYYGGNIPFLSISDITQQGKNISHTEKHISKQGLANSSAWLVPSNSLIITMYASVGLACINRIPLATSQAMFSAILKDNRDLDYLYYYLNYYRQTQIHRLLETGTQSNINADIVKAIKIPFVSKKPEYVKTMLSIEKKLDNEKALLSKLQELKRFLLANLFI